MGLKILKPRKALNKAFLKIKPNRTEIESFKTNLIQLLDRINDTESEEFHKNLVSDFLKKTYYEPNHFINTKGRNDLVIHNGNKAKNSVGVIIEAKKPTNKVGMLTKDKINVKAFHELILYYLRERITHKNLEINYLVATNIHEWFIFDSNVFEKQFAQNKGLVKLFNDFENGRLAGKTTDFFYKEIAEPFVNDLKQAIECTFFDIRTYEKLLRNDNPKDDNTLISLFKLLSPTHLLKLPYANDSNSLDKQFYGELLYIIGLVETKNGSKKLIERNKKGERNTGSFLENTIIQLDSLDKINRLNNPSHFGTTQEERLFNVSLELSLTWINRILFLKLLEAQLKTYHKGDKSYNFLSSDKIQNYDDLNTLFFQVLAKKQSERSEDVTELFAKIPYLNSSLFEPMEIEQEMFAISGLENNQTIPIYSSTVLKSESGKKRTGNLSTLEYLFEFLNAYDFSSEGKEEIQEDNKTLINASVLGLIFEKINGYKEGSFFTPGFITMYMCRETLRRAVVQKFNDTKDWKCENLDDIYDKIENRKEANDIINSLKICDPAVGSGHFLVSALNEMIAIKNDLKILQDRDGKRLKEYQFEVVNDDLIVTDEEGEFFEYKPTNKESQRIQEALFHEKQTIIENCLFGVDINPNSVKICRLRLWIELLKNAYYKNENELETLPNIDINIKCGNSLISRFELDISLAQAFKNNKKYKSIEVYKTAVMQYKNTSDKATKHELERLIKDIKENFVTNIANYSDPRKIKLAKLGEKLFDLTGIGKDGFSYLVFEPRTIYGSKKNLAKRKKEIEDIEKKINSISAELEDTKNNKIYEKAFEWRFEFPEVLNDNGDFVGFDAVIGNPPYLKEYEGKEIFDGLRENEVYQGKMDIWYMFTADGIKLLKDKGTLNFIAPNNWVTNTGAGKMRNFMLQNSKFISLIDFSDYMVFDAASIQTMIIQFEKIKTDDYSFHYKRLTKEKPVLDDALNLLESNDNTNEVLKPTIKKVEYLNKNLTFNSNDVDVILNKISNQSNFKLNEKKEVAQGIVGAPDKCFIIDKSSTSHFSKGELQFLKLFYTRSNRYIKKDTEKMIFYISDKNFKNKNISEYPNIEKHFKSHKEVLIKSKIKYKTPNKPYFYLHRERIESFFLKGEKIVISSRVFRPEFMYTKDEFYVSRATNIIKTKRLNMKYLCGFLNSKITNFWLKNKGKRLGYMLQIDKAPLLDIPIIKPTKNAQNQIAQIVSKIIKSKKQTSQTDTTHLENEIDQLVYQLYNLTKEEIKIIEETSI